MLASPRVNADATLYHSIGLACQGMFQVAKAMRNSLQHYPVAREIAAAAESAWFTTGYDQTDVLAILATGQMEQQPEEV